MTIVLDTNCLLRILPRKANQRWLFNALLQGQLNLALSSEILLEYEEKIDQFFQSQTLGSNVCQQLLELAQTLRIEVYFHWQLITHDPDDDKYVDCAVAANADFIITNDGHFKVLKNLDFPKIACMTLEQFKEYWEGLHGMSN